LSAWEYPNIVNVFFVLVTVRVKVERGRICDVAPGIVRHDGNVIPDLALVGITLRWIKWLAYRHVSRPSNASISAVRIE
jgi:hypothetical protein